MIEIFQLSSRLTSFWPVLPLCLLEGDKHTLVDADVRVPVGVARPETVFPGAVDGRRDLFAPVEEGHFTPLEGNCTQNIVTVISSSKQI